MTRYWSGPKPVTEVEVVRVVDALGRTWLSIDPASLKADWVPHVPIYEPPAQRVDEDGNPIRPRVVLTR